MSSSVTRSFFCDDSNADVYFVGTDNVHVAYQGSTIIIPIGGSTREGTATMNDAGKNILFPNSTAHPTSLYVYYWHYSGTSHKNNKTEFRLGGTALLSQASDTKEEKSGTFTSSVVTSATKSTAIQFYLKSNTSLGWVSVGGEGVNILASFTRYNFSATAGSNVSSASVSSSTGYDGGTIRYRCVLASGATWQGWYLNGSLYSSTKDLDITVNGTDLALEARATVPTTKTLSATYDGSQLSGFPKSVSGDVALTYNGASKGSVPFSGGTKTFWCADKVASGNITIGGTTLECANKLMKSDVVVSIS